MAQLLLPCAPKARNAVNRHVTAFGPYRVTFEPAGTEAGADHRSRRNGGA